ncbi:MAG: single-stranded DNA-binding protein [Spirochaetaceae bacterium]
MAKDINSVTIVGRLTRDSELKYTNSGFAISKLSLAVNSTKKDGDQWVEEANFIDVTLLGRLGETLNQYLLKGKQIAVIGELKQDRWEQDGQKRSKVYVLGNNIQLLGGNSPGQGGGQSYSGNNQKSNFNQGNQNSGNNNHNNNSVSNNKPSYENYPSGNQGGNGNFEDDIPF